VTTLATNEELRMEQETKEEMESVLASIKPSLREASKQSKVI